MERLPPELISHMMRFLSVSDRKEAAVVCKAWYGASLHPLLQRDIVVKCTPPGNETIPPDGLVRRKLTRLDFTAWDSQKITAENVLNFLSKCPSLVELDLTGCSNLFLSGRFLEKANDRNTLKQALVNVRDLKLGCLRFITDITFTRLVSVMENLEKISLSSTNMIYGSGLYDVNQVSPAMLHFSTFLKFVAERVDKIKRVDLSYTSVHDDALNSLAKIDKLFLSEISLQGCTEISDKGVKMLVSHQRRLKLLDLSNCRQLGNGKTFFSTLVNNLPHLHTLNLRKCVKMGQCDLQSLADMKSLRCLDLGEVLNLFDKDVIKGLCGPGTRLTSLSLPYCPDIRDEFICELVKSSYYLTELDLSSCLKLTDTSVLAITSTLTGLRLLRLSYCRDISDIGILGYMPENGVVPSISFDFDHDGCPCTRERDSKIFRKPTGTVKEHKTCVSKAHVCLEQGEKLNMLSNLKSLQVLDLSSCSRITDVSIAEAVRFRELRSLSLNSMPKVKDAAIVSIARHNPSLEEVNLMANSSITDVAVAELVFHCKRLSSLDLSQCGGLTDACLNHIAAAGQRLRRLEVSFTNLSPDAVAALEAKLPKVKVIFRPHLY